MRDNDCGFCAAMGELGDLDAMLDEAALSLQHTESYERFIRHAVEEVLSARELRKKQKEEKEERELKLSSRKEGKEAQPKNKHPIVKPTNPKLDILPPQTQLNEAVSELGGHYSILERALLLASMQRAFLNMVYPDDSNFSPIGLPSTQHQGNAPGSRALHTSIVEESFYAAKHGTKRAFATGHTGTACAAANFCADSLGRMLTEVLIRRTERSTATLKGLLAAGGLSGTIMGQAALNVMKRAEKNLLTAKGASHHSLPDKEAPASGKGVLRSQQTILEIARACASYNDLEVAVSYTRKLESQFLSDIESGFPRGQSTEQLGMCVKSFSPVLDSFKIASQSAIESLVNAIVPRVRTIANDAVGLEAQPTSFMGKTAKTQPAAARMDYDLDDEAYERTQRHEGYMNQALLSLDELLAPLTAHLLPSLSDSVLLGAYAAAAKRIEHAVRKSRVTALGALSFESDVRHFVGHAKERLYGAELRSTLGLYKACTPLARLAQIALLMSVDDLEDVLDLISTSKRKGTWDLKLEDAKAFLNLRVEFEGKKVNDLLKIEND